MKNQLRTKSKQRKTIKGRKRGGKEGRDKLIEVHSLI